MATTKQPLDPYRTTCICRDASGKEVGRVSATAQNASRYMETLVQHYGEISVEYVEDEYAWIGAALSRRV